MYINTFCIRLFRMHKLLIKFASGLINWLTSGTHRITHMFKGATCPLGNRKRCDQNQDNSCVIFWSQDSAVNHLDNVLLDRIKITVFLVTAAIHWSAGCIQWLSEMRIFLITESFMPHMLTQVFLSLQGEVERGSGVSRSSSQQSHSVDSQPRCEERRPPRGDSPLPPQGVQLWPAKVSS